MTNVNPKSARIEKLSFESKKGFKFATENEPFTHLHHAISMLKIIVIINWIAIGILALLVLAETLFPAKGGDAAGKGIGQAIYYLAIFALAILLILNLLPWNWAKYLAFGLMLLPFLVIKMDGIWKDTKKYLNRDTTPVFEDRARVQIADALYDGNTRKLEELLKPPPPLLNERGSTGRNLLEIAIAATGIDGAQKQARVTGLQMLLEAGARPDSIDIPDYIDPVALKILLDHKADPNRLVSNYSTGERTMPMLFEFIQTTYGTSERALLLITYGANPNALRPADSNDRPLFSAAMYAAVVNEWKICRTLLEKGADVKYQTPDGQSLKTIMAEAEGDSDDFEAVKKIVSAAWQE